MRIEITMLNIEAMSRGMVSQLEDWKDCAKRKSEQLRDSRAYESELARIFSNYLIECFKVMPEKT